MHCIAQTSKVRAIPLVGRELTQLRQGPSCVPPVAWAPCSGRGARSPPSVSWIPPLPAQSTRLLNVQGVMEAQGAVRPRDQGEEGPRPVPGEGGKQEGAPGVQPGAACVGEISLAWPAGEVGGRSRPLQS